MDQTPSVGRIVHYVSRGSADGVFPSVCRAAIITDVETIDDQSATPIPTTDLSLCVLNPTGMFFDQHVPWDQPLHDNGTQQRLYGGTWHWPERV